MRWQLIDEFELLKKGSRSRAHKFFSGKEDFFQDHFPGKPIVPQTLLIEMIAQTGGVLYGLDIDFKKEVILVKVDGADFPEIAVPPCMLSVEGKIDEESEAGAWISGVVKCKDAVVGRARIMLAAMDELVKDSTRKIVFNDRFLSHYRILQVAAESGRRA
jgi:3-hydroxyacyl-[acyl-carrier-protein] dehydratase